MPVIQWTGASRCVPACSPTVTSFHAQAGPASSKLLTGETDKPTVFANGCGRFRMGVSELSGVVRSMISTEPLERAAVSPARTDIVLLSLAWFQC
ncbi:hypothetical protein D3C73_1449190 [compost metagenome]